MNYLHLQMNGIRRNTRFPFPVQSLGYIEDSMTTAARNFYTDKVEFCIRLDSEEHEAVDRLNDQEFHTPFPHVIVKDYQHVHAYRIFRKRNAFYLIYSRQIARKLIEAGFHWEELVWQLRLTPRIFRLIQDLRELFPASHLPYTADRIDILSYELLLEIFSERDVHTQKNEFKEKISSIASLLQLHFNKNLNLDELIEQNGFSRRSFFRHWNASYGVSPHQYVLQMRLKEAARLLKETNKPVHQIGEELGFSCSSYFVQTFRGTYRCTPGQYRLEKNLQPK